MNESDYSRYSRLSAIPEIGREGIQKLSATKVLIIGAGALGSMVAMQLAASGVGRIDIADFDTIDISNLQRQLFFKEEECGKPKVKILAERMSALNSNIDVRPLQRLIREQDALTLFPEYDFIIDGSDNPSTKYMTDRVLALTAKPGSIAGVNQWSGQVMTYIPGATRYSDIFGDEPKREKRNAEFLPCSIAGVVGAAAAIAASIQACETIKHLIGIPQLLADSVLIFDLLQPSFSIISIPKLR